MIRTQNYIIRSAAVVLSTLLALILLYGISDTTSVTEIRAVERTLAKKYHDFDIAFSAFKPNFLDFQSHSDVNFLVYDEQGKLTAWTANIFTPPLQTFLSSPSPYLLATEQGDFLFKGYEITKDDQRYRVFAFLIIRRTAHIGLNRLVEQYSPSVIPGNMTIVKDKTPEAMPVKFKQGTLFYVKWNGQPGYSAWMEFFIYLFVIVFFGSFFITSHYVAIYMRKKGYGLIPASLALIIIVVGFRVVMVYFQLPYRIFPLSALSPEVFSYGYFFFSLGDSMLNVFAINIVLLFVVTQEAEAVKRRSKLILTPWQRLIRVLTVSLSYLALYAFVSTIEIIHTNSHLAINVGSSITFSFDRIVAFFVVGSFGVLYFLISFLGIYYFRYYNFKTFALYHFFGLLFVLAILHDTYGVWIIIGGHLLYSSSLYYYRSWGNVRKWRFDSLNYLMLSTVFLAFVACFFLRPVALGDYKDKAQAFFSSQADENLKIARLLSHLTNQVKRDSAIHEYMLHFRPEYEKEIVRRIQRKYWNHYFYPVQLSLTLFDAKGKPWANPAGESVSQLEHDYQAGTAYATPYPHVYFHRDPHVPKRKKFLCFVTLRAQKSVIGYLQIEGRWKKFYKEKVLPKLFTDQWKSKKLDFEYAIYDHKDRLSFQSGSFNYQSHFTPEVLKNKQLYMRDMEFEGLYHVGIKSEDKTFIISLPRSNLFYFTFNTSFLFAAFLSFGSLVMFFNYLFGAQVRRHLTFSNKILLYSTASFIIPLLVVGITVMSSTYRSNQEEIDTSHMKKSQIIAENLYGILARYDEKSLSQEVLEDKLTYLSDHTGLDLNVYNKKGILWVSTVPKVFEEHLFSCYAAPQAMTSIVKRNGAGVIVDSKCVTNTAYKTAYVPIQSPHTGAILGVLGVPYFSFINHLKKHQRAVFDDFVTIFALVFILEVFLAYIIINRLTRPIVTIARRLQDTRFEEEENPPIRSNAKGEMGMIIHAYNHMVKKLNSAKVELAIKEKESAWQEMAKQVAHEIKNPLTPMKLTLQHLQRILAKKENQKFLEILLSQIDTLDEIVTSFSHFAKMPTPKNKPFDIRATLDKTINLHVDKQIEKTMEEGVFMVLGDEKLFGRVFHNLILNAFQAMKTVAHPKLYIRLYIKEQLVFISFKDIGDGIPQAIQDQIFYPNFSTKKTGSGIGLSVAKRGIEHAGGKIWFKTAEGEGTNFFIMLPLVKAESWS